jgi:hypothetical protein
MIDLRPTARLLGRAVLLATIFITVIGVAWVVSTRAQTENLDSQDAGPPITTTPSALFQFSTLTGSGDTITATEVPVLTSSGTTVYKNVTTQFNVDSAGNLTLAAGFPQVVAASPPSFSSFKAGNYVGPATLGSGKFLITVGGPTVAPGGTTWGSTVAAGANAATYPISCSWYDGPISNSPEAPRLKTDGITSTALSYGTCTGPCPVSGTNNYYWCPRTLVGVSQAGQVITFYSFTYAETSDSSSPQDTIAYTLLQ